ncbi:Presenilin-2 [Trichinella pseudospiralis]|uniref:Presenilin n=1 Tax=Trichinella pseudospiralis TaxID=6337 RepID=A0A0V1KG83_TRIPS|nr:Presenilin-2 [Trichinella pseudospiralis]KRZ32029.1 Presenilin-2 [Trichinella pseudospiralis]KRZ46207.1 Presenilin-2 [Trichinella pseudospiralis]
MSGEQATFEHPLANERNELDENSMARESSSEQNRIDLKYGAEHVIMLITPVSLCMLVVIATMNTVGYYRTKDIYLIYAPFHSDTEDVGTIVWESLANAGIMLCVIIVMTVFLILLYKYRFYRFIHGWLLFSSLIMLSLFSLIFLRQVFFTFNVPIDYVTVTFAMWNYAVVGLISIHWKAPLRLQQAYLIMVSALLALIFIKFLPDWTTWAVLVCISFWDLVAVLCPRGPLRMLVEMAQERDEPIFPALIYSSTIVYGCTGGEDKISSDSGNSQLSTDSAKQGPSDSSSKVVNENGVVCVHNQLRGTLTRRLKQPKNQDRATGDIAQLQPYTDRRETTMETENSVSEEPRGVKLGLGDFIFYSVLVGKASSYGDWSTTVACFVAILVGLCLTLFLLAIFEKALPALPISILLGILFYFATSLIISPFANTLASNQIFA